MSDKDKLVAELNERIEKLQSQKNSLLKEMDAIEERFEASDNTYRKYFPYVIDLVKDENSSYSDVLTDLSKALKKGESFGKVEYILKQIQEKIYREDPDTNRKKKRKSPFLSGMFASSRSRDMDEFKQGFTDIVNSLKSVMGTQYISDLNKIGGRIALAEDLKELSAIREDLFARLRHYLAGVTNDREKIARFVQDIVKKILDIESGLDSSFQHAGDVLQSGREFNSFLKTELGQMKNSLDVAKNLDELRVEVSERLTSIEDALKTKREKDDALQEGGEKNRKAFQSDFQKLKQELDQATRHSKELETRLNQDPLTKAFNRRAYDQKIIDEMERFLRYNTVFSLLMLDADHFKAINDNYGHAVGDKCLQEIIKRTAPLLRKNDMLARYGGEEFVIVMPETSGKGAEQVAEKIRQTIEKIEFIYRQETVRVTVSIGVSQVKQEDRSHKELFDRVDTAVYQAKEEGRNRVVRID
ncbi:MAG: diguanylate cyclase [Desulfobacteraceae bacterium]